MNRREFLIKTLMFGAGTAAAVPGMHLLAGNKTASLYNQLKTIRRNVGTFTGRGGTIGWLADQNGMVIIDSQFPPSARRFFNELRGKGAEPLHALINTHHHADHTGGNLYFRNIADQIVAHDNVPDLQRRMAEEQDAVIDQVYPETTFNTDWSLDTGDEIVHAFHYGPAHTAGDIVILFEKANIIHMGDLVFNRWYPFIDTDGGAVISNWIEILEKVVANAENDTIFIYGHGNADYGITGTADDLLTMRDYLSALLDYVEQNIAEGNSLNRTASLGRLDSFSDYISPGARLSFRANVEAAWHELY